ncbi:HU family DNA-binding protein [Periweissella cryptocerci]|uniref:DNA-binding protein HU n=1 Tax=Periweissella cryptocerci TaxID=2506420 RepID=A0A4P6YWZ5_9LACO|nr:HU family DNA-binding protein [Periweissella cryptocerci]QBO37402.1 HU family DNA-binding protein [Periweissella cryptocerci]
MANKQDLIKDVAGETGLTKKDSAIVVDAVLNGIIDFLGQGQGLLLVGFGNFEVKERAARKGRNPRTGAEIEIAATTVPVFKPGKILKEAVKN